jgi:hypothetical protein
MRSLTSLFSKTSQPPLLLSLLSLLFRARARAQTLRSVNSREMSWLAVLKLLPCKARGRSFDLFK